MTGTMHSTRSFVTATAFAVAMLVVLANPVAAQEAGSRAEEQAREQEKKAQALATYRPPWIERQLLEIERAGGFGVARGVILTFGDIKRGSGIALGPAYGKTFASGAVFFAKAGYSVNKYKLLQTSIASPPIANGSLWFKGRVRWQDAPAVSVFPIGPDSPHVDAKYSETKTELSGYGTFRPVRLLRFEAGAGVERYQSGLAYVPKKPDLTPMFEGLPGGGADPRYLHGYASAAIDSRDGEGYSRRGTLLRGTLHDYHEENGGPYSFQRVDGDAEQYVPILQGNWVLYLGLHASTTSTSPGHTVPFFLMPDLGGNNLRGFVNYRFRDRHSLLVTAEYRWYAQEYLDAAIFYDAGKTVPDRSALDFTGLKSAVGAGIRLHGAQSTVVRFDVAHSREGFRFVLAFTPVGG
jgi:hypothetical protein